MTLSQAFQSLCNGAITVDEYLAYYKPEERPYVFIPPQTTRRAEKKSIASKDARRHSRCLDNFRDDPFFGRSF